MAEISSDVIRGYNDTMILRILLDAPSYGYEISKEITRRSDGKYRIKETTLYSAFTRLERNGLTESFSDVGKENGKRRTYYRLTEAGRHYYREKCEEWQLTKDVVEQFVVDCETMGDNADEVEANEETRDNAFETTDGEVMKDDRTN